MAGESSQRKREFAPDLPSPTAGARGAESLESELESKLHALQRELTAKDAELDGLREKIAEYSIRLMDALESLAEGFVLLNSSYVVIIVNQNLQDLFPDLPDAWSAGASLPAAFDQLAKGGYEFRCDGEARTPARAFETIRSEGSGQFVLIDREQRWITLNAAPTTDGGFVLTLQDISELKAKEREIRDKSRLLEATLNSIGQGICVFDEGGNLTTWNSLFGEMLELPDALLRPGARAKLLADHSKDFAALYESTAYGEDGHPAAMEGYKPPEEIMVGRRHVEIKRFPMPDGGLVTTVTDVTDRREAEQLLIRKATVDELTGLPNRMVGIDRLNAAVTRAGRDETNLAVMFVDLDGFKNVNDTHGHAVGDDLIRMAGQRMTECLRKSDTVARLGGDEFLVILPDIPDPHHSTMVGDKLVESLAAPFDISGNAITVSCSVGITIYPLEGETSDDLLKNADMAMYSAKSMGKNRYRRYTPDMGAEAPPSNGVQPSGASERRSHRRRP